MSNLKKFKDMNDERMLYAKSIYHHKVTITTTQKTEFVFVTADEDLQESKIEMYFEMGEFDDHIASCVGDGKLININIQ
jgi:hypothetical protein